MKKTIAAVTLSLALISSAAMAQERTGDAALGHYLAPSCSDQLVPWPEPLSAIPRDHRLRALGV